MIKCKFRYYLLLMIFFINWSSKENSGFLVFSRMNLMVFMLNIFYFMKCVFKYGFNNMF